LVFSFYIITFWFCFLPSEVWTVWRYQTSKAINRRTDHTMAKRNRTNNDPQNIKKR